MKQLNKKGQIVNNLQGFVMAVVTIGVVLAIGLYVLQQVSDNTLMSCEDRNGTLNSTTGLCDRNSTDSTQVDLTTGASNATDSVVDSLANTPTWIALLIVVVFATAILAYFYFKG